MTESFPPPPPYAYGPPQQWMPPPPPRTHAELTWQDLIALIFGCFTPLSIVALGFGHHSWTEANKQGLKMHAVGMIGLIFGAIGSACWTLLWVVVLIGRMVNTVGH